jgi:hypothetical protein
MQQASVFIVRIWCEPREIEGAPPLWRGVIEHMPSGERRYVQSLQEIVDLIALYLDDILSGCKPTSIAQQDKNGE